MDLFLLAHGCPNCGGEVSDGRLARGLLCPRCLPAPGKRPLCAALGERLARLAPFCRAEEEFAARRALFERALGQPPTGLQETWLRRVALRESFAIVAPTGTGKTTFGLVAALGAAGRRLVLVPTRLLVQQVGERLSALARRAGCEARVLAYLGRREDRARWAARDFDLLVATLAFFHRHLEELVALDFGFVFVDDVDSFLRRSVHVRGLSRLLGFSPGEIALAAKARPTEEERRRLEEARRRQAGEKVLLVSSATLRPRPARVRLFQALLGFDVQQAVSSLRRVVDACLPVPDDLAEMASVAAGLVRALGPGGLVFAPARRGREGVGEVVARLRAEGLRVLSYLELGPEELVRAMAQGDFDVAVGLAHLQNPLVRGLDLPSSLRYALFLGVPRHLVPLRVSALPRDLHLLLVNLLPALPDEDRARALEELAFLRPHLALSPEAVSRRPRLASRLEEIRAFLAAKLADEGLLRALASSEDVSLVREGEDLFLVVGDAATYLQGSGRVSRLTASGLLPGLSVVLSEDARALRSLERRLRLELGDEFSFRPLEELDLAALAEELDRARRDGACGSGPGHVGATLVVVESPHKARTIASFFGRPARRKVGDLLVHEIPTEDRLLLVTASLGHVLNLSRRRGFFGVLEEDGRFLPVFDTIKLCRATGEQLVDPEEVERRCPEGPVEDRAELIRALERLAFEVHEVLLASDPDAEGEKIAYDLLVALRPFNRNIRRLEFHEVTPRAFREALASPRAPDLHRVRAQLARRVVDRWVGFVLSRRLWRAFGRHRLSAGRVQTPVLGWVVERAEAARRKRPRVQFRLFGRSFLLDLEDRARAERLAREVREHLRYEVVHRREELRHPPPPFTTDTALHEAGRRLGLPVRDTMALLQELFESGLITYHRTDSTRVSAAGRYQVARPYLVSRFGPDYFQPRPWGEGGAHEAIRPTRPRDPDEVRYLAGAGLVSLSRPREAAALYELVFRRFMASQMRASRVVVATVRFETPSHAWEEELVSAVLEDGFEREWPAFEVVNPVPGEAPEGVACRLVPAAELYTEATLVQEMKSRGLGRPSTYAEIVGTLLRRGYVRRLPGGRLAPTTLGRRVLRFLREHFPEETDEELTRRLEEALDRIERGELDHQEVLREASRLRRHL